MKSLLFQLTLFTLFCCGIARGQGTLYTVENNGPRSQRVNIVFLSEGYTAASLPTFAGHVQSAVNYMFSREPWSRYRPYCNVYRIEVASVENGCDQGSANAIRNTYFSTGFNTPSITQLLTLSGNGTTLAYNLLNAHVPEYDVPVILVNDTKYGGSGGQISIASANYLSTQIVEHEIGHSFAGLADEYDTNYTQYTPAEAPNNTAQTSRALIKWKAWIDASTPVPTPETATYDAAAGLFEGSMYRTSGWYRPHNNSLMRSLNRPVGQINREQFVISFYDRVDLTDSRLPAGSSFNVTTSQSIPFSVVPKVPVGGNLNSQWFVDGISQAGAITPSFSVHSASLGNGSHTVKVRVSDPTPYVRSDPNLKLRQEITWNISLSNQLPANLATWRTAFGPDQGNPSGDGFVNLIKYALVLDPAKPIGLSQRPQAGYTRLIDADYLTLAIDRVVRRTDITYTVEVSSDLSHWESGAGSTAVIEDTESRLVVRDALPQSANSKRAMRLKITTL